MPRTQGSAISIIEYLVTLAAPSTDITRWRLGPRDKPEEIIRGDETDATINDEISIPPPVFPETPQALSGILRRR